MHTWKYMSGNSFVCARISLLKKKISASVSHWPPPPPPLFLADCHYYYRLEPIKSPLVYMCRGEVYRIYFWNLQVCHREKAFSTLPKPSLICQKPGNVSVAAWESIGPGVCVEGGGGEAKEVVKDNWNLAKVSISKRINSLFVFISK